MPITSATVDVTITMRCYDPQALFDYGLEHYYGENPADRAEGVIPEWFGTRKNPDIGNLLRQCLDQGLAIDGCETEDSTAETLACDGDEDEDDDPEGLPVIITLNRKDAQPGEQATDFIGRFQTEDQASAYLSLSASIDPDRLDAGDYGIETLDPHVFVVGEPVTFTSTASDGPGPCSATVLRQLTDDEADPEGGPMYEIKLGSGKREHAFGFELTAEATELPDGWDD